MKTRFSSFLFKKYQGFALYTTKLRSISKEVVKRYLDSDDFKRIKKQFRQYPQIYSQGSPLIICQAVEDFLFLHRIAHFLFGYSELKNTKIDIGWLVIRKNFKTRTFKTRFTDSLFHNSFTDHIWLSIYKTLGGKIALHYSKNTAIRSGAYQWAELTFSRISSKDNLVELHIQDVLVGDLIYDTYLRFKPAPTIDIKDPFLLELLTWCYDLHHQIGAFLDKHPVAAVATSYTSYIQHGLLVRLALTRNIPVYAFGMFNQVVVNPTADFPYHKRNFHKYRDFFSKISDKPAALAMGKKLLDDRIGGQIDNATAYLSKSAYGSSTSTAPVFKNSGKPRAVVMGHDFYDSPHIYGKMLFSDFYEWISFIFTEAKSSTYDFYYKPHPNGLPENDRINEDLRSRYPYIHFIDKGVSNRSMIAEGFNIAFSVYGTVSHEFAYQGIPVISAGDNPHQVYRFNICAQTRDELKSYVSGKTIPVLDNSEVSEFCFVHNYRYLDGSLKEFPFFLSNKNLPEHFSLENLSSRVQAMKENIKRCDSI